MIHNVLTLNNGIEIPQLGLGTWFIRDDIVADAIKEAVNIGYRHFDTAQAYGNERGVGEGIRNCGIPRDEIKLFIENNGGSITGSVSKNTDAVIVGADPGSKYDKALTLNIKIINKEEIKQIMGK